MKDFKTSFTVSESPQEVFEAVNRVNDWWGNTTGDSQKVGDEFIYRHGDMHYSKHRITEMIPGEKVAWLTVDSQLNFVEDKDEWNGGSITFHITEQDGQTTLTFTQRGLTPERECYNACSGAWGFYVGESLRELITQGKGQPDQ